MHRDITAAMRIVNTETVRVLSKLDIETCLRIAMRARNEGRMEAVFPIDEDRLRNLTAAPDLKAPIDSWEVELSVNGKSLLALSDSTMAAVVNVKEFAPIIRTMAGRISEFVGDGPNSAGQRVASAATPGPTLCATDMQKVQDAAAFLAKQPGFEDAATLIQSIVGYPQTRVEVEHG
jgi:hypothetical protein